MSADATLWIRVPYDLTVRRRGAETVRVVSDAVPCLVRSVGAKGAPVVARATRSGERHDFRTLDGALIRPMSPRGTGSTVATSPATAPYMPLGYVSRDGGRREFRSRPYAEPGPSETMGPDSATVRKSFRDVVVDGRADAVSKAAFAARGMALVDGVPYVPARAPCFAVRDLAFAHPTRLAFPDRDIHAWGALLPHDYWPDALRENGLPGSGESLVVLEPDAMPYTAASDRIRLLATMVATGASHLSVCSMPPRTLRVVLDLFDLASGIPDAASDADVDAADAFARTLADLPPFEGRHVESLARACAPHVATAGTRSRRTPSVPEDEAALALAFG